MKVHQIIAERTKPLNEAVPLVIAGVGIGTIITAISVGMSAWSAYEIYKFIGKYNEDPEAITDEQWEDLWIDAILMFTPGFAKLGKVGILKLIPKSWQSKGGRWLKGKVTERLANLEKAVDKIEKINLRKYDPDSKVGWDKIKAYLKMRGANSAMKAAAQSRMGFIPDVVMTVLKTAVGLEFVREYYVDLSVLEQEYEDYKAGKDSPYGKMTEQEAYNKYQQLRRKLLGELTIGIAMNMGVASKAFGAIGGMFKGITKFAAQTGGSGFVVADLMGKTVNLPFAVAKGLAKIIEMGPAAPAFLIFMRTSAGKEFLNSTLIRAITEPTGAITSAAIDLLELALQEAGLLDGKLPGKTDVKPPTGDAADGPRQATNGMNIQWVGKKLYVNNVQISDDDGYRIVGNDRFNDIKNDARVAGIADPTLKLRDDPNRKYSMYGAEPIK
jgi:hypothetical protein